MFKDKGTVLEHTITERPKKDGSGNFLSGDLVLTIDKSYKDREGNWVDKKEDIPFNCFGKVAEQARSLPVGAEVEISFDTRGRFWNDRYYSNLNLIAVKVAGAEPPF